MGNLFDERRKKAIQQGLKAGKLDISGKKPVVEGVMREQNHAPTRPEERSQVTEPREALMGDGIPARYFDDEEENGAVVSLSKLQKIAFQKTDLRYELFHAIRERDLQKVQDAITHGADMNTPIPTKVLGGGEPRERVMITMATPLELAQELGFDDVAELLRKNGANA